MNRLLRWADARSRLVISSLALLLLTLIGAVDYLTPPEITTSVFYFAPIALAAWFAGRASGLLMALLATGTWMAKDIAFRGIPYAEQWILFWNTAARLFMFSLVAWLITEVRLHLLREQRLARTDALTGLLNARAFHDELALELARAARASLTVSFAYIDLDNFKLVNDESGHAEGDRALGVVAATLRHELRRSDTLGRLGGDEFAVVLPATDTQEANIVVSKLHAALTSEMARQAWPITFSIGLITCAAPPSEPDALIGAADQLMYQVKAAGKNAFLHRTWPVAG